MCHYMLKDYTKKEQSNEKNNRKSIKKTDTREG